MLDEQPAPFEAALIKALPEFALFYGDSHGHLKLLLKHSSYLAHSNAQVMALLRPLMVSYHRTAELTDLENNGRIECWAPYSLAEMWAFRKTMLEAVPPSVKVNSIAFTFFDKYPRITMSVEQLGDAPALRQAIQQRGVPANVYEIEQATFSF